MKELNFINIIIGLMIITGCQTKTVTNTGEQTQKIFSKKIIKKIEGQYLIYLPEDYAKKEKEWPLMIFLHGIGERGSDINKVKVHGPPKLIANGHAFPFIVVSPQCPAEQWWTAEYLDVIFDEVLQNHNVDKNRIYLTGLSMGGFGTWAWAQEHPERFAAIAPICGGGETIRAEVFKDLPVWVFHGEQDMVVPFKRSQEMVDALKEVGNDVKFTAYPDAGHDSWTETYNNEELYAWFLDQRR